MKAQKLSMNLDGIIRKVALSTGIPLKECGELVKKLVDTMKKGLLRHEVIEIRGFGTFKVRHRKEKWARNVRKNTQVFVPGHFAPVFIPGKVLKSGLNKTAGNAPKN